MSVNVYQIVASGKFKHNNEGVVQEKYEQI